MSLYYADDVIDCIEAEQRVFEVVTFISASSNTSQCKYQCISI